MPGRGKIDEYNKSLSSEQRIINAKKAAAASVRAKAKAKEEGKARIADIRAIARLINEAPMGADMMTGLSMLNVENQDLTNAAGIAMAVFQAAINGDMKAVAKWEQYVGQAESAQSGENGMLADLIDGLKDEE